MLWKFLVALLARVNNRVYILPVKMPVSSVSAFHCPRECTPLFHCVSIDLILYQHLISSLTSSQPRVALLANW